MIAVPHGEERAADGGVQGDEAGVLLVEVVLAEDFAECAEVVAGVFAGYYADVGPRGDVRGDGVVSVEDEDEVRGGVEGFGKEVLDVGAGGVGFGVGVED